MESAYKSARPSSFYDSLKIKQETQAIVVKDPPKLGDFGHLPPIRDVGIGLLIIVLIFGFIAWVLD